MKHFYKYLTENDDNLDKLSGKKVTVTLKVDGTSLHVTFSDRGTVVFCRKGSSQSKPGDELNSISLYLVKEYYKPALLLKKNIEGDVGDFSGYINLLNFEILAPNDYHVIQYNTYPENNLCLLNAFNSEGLEIRRDMLEGVAKDIQVSMVPLVFSGTLSDDQLRQIDAWVRKYDNPQDIQSMPKDNMQFNQRILSILGVKGNIPLCDTKDGHSEGFVFDFAGVDGKKELYLKIDDPYFTEKIMEGKSGSGEDDPAEGVITPTEKLVDAYMDTIRGKNYKFKKMSGNPLENAALNFDGTFGQEPQVCRYLADVYRKSGSKITTCSNELLPDNIRQKADDPDYSLALRGFVWLFTKERTAPLDKVNPIGKAMKLF